jgi:hypothetical protein
MSHQLLIDDNTYEVPDKLTIKQFRELANWDITLESNWRKILSIVMDIPYTEALLVPDKTVELVVTFLLDKIYPDSSPVKKGAFDIKNINVGLFVDMEVLISKGVQKSIYEIIERLYEVEPNDKMYIYDYYGGIKYYLNWRLNIFNSYRKLFGLDDEFSKNDIELEEKVDPSYNWYQFLMVLCDEKFLDINKVVDEPIIQALNFLAYKKDKAENEKRRLDDIQRNSRFN